MTNLDDRDLARVEQLIDGARSKLARTGRFLPPPLVESLETLLEELDDFHDEVLEEAGVDPEHPSA